MGGNCQIFKGLDYIYIMGFFIKIYFRRNVYKIKRQKWRNYGKVEFQGILLLVK